MKITSEFIQLPPLNVCFVEKSQNEKNGLGVFILYIHQEFPIYLNASREKMLTKIKLP